jgi:hypothetical protein
MKTQQEIILECAQAAAACWNHYSDEPLNRAQRDRLEWAVRTVMPQSVSTKDWQAAADERARRMEAECIEAHKEGRSRPLQDFIDELKANL